MNRVEKVIACRPTIASKDSINISSEEKFQNEVLRPILKFQNNLLIKLFLSKCENYKINFTQLNTEDKHKYIDKTLKKDSRLKTLFIGTIVALFTLEEYEKYAENEQTYNKRILQMLIERLKNQTV